MPEKPVASGFPAVIPPVCRTGRKSTYTMKSPADWQPTSRFSDRVDDYERYRPGYPVALRDWLALRAGLRPGAPVADIGAGTGLFTRELLEAGLQVTAVEPNAAMRAVAERQFAGHPGFRSVEGTAERTTLDDRSVELITVAQAFHWFEPAATRAEFERILRSEGSVALIWNVRRIDGAFAQAYERLLLETCPAYADGVPVQADAARVAAFFAPAEAEPASFDYEQRLDFDGLRGRLLSSSYTPKAGDPRRAPLLDALRSLFDRHADSTGRVRFGYDTRVFFGRLPAAG